MTANGGSQRRQGQQVLLARGPARFDARWTVILLAFGTAACPAEEETFDAAPGDSRNVAGSPEGGQGGDGGAQRDAEPSDTQLDVRLCSVELEAACADGCLPLSGSIFSEAASCWGPTQQLACAHRGQAFGEFGGCYVRIATGAIYGTGSLYFESVPGIRRCDDDERGRLAHASSCE